MNSLFWRIFWSFWLVIALILVGTVTAAVNEAFLHREHMPWVQRGQLFAQAARAFESGGPAALDGWLEGLTRSHGRFSDRTFVIGPDGRDLLGRPLPEFLRPFFEPRPMPDHPRARAAPPISGALVLMTPDGRIYQVVVTALHHHSLLFLGALGLPGVAGTTLAVALVVSTVICLLLARYLVRPIGRLRQAARRMAAGDLDVRVRPGLAGRHDDLARLAEDFDAMAERVRGLLESKQQLLRDVSHELRSPLTRLQLALSLASRSEELPRQLARIGREADRLEQLIARILKLARLERRAGQIDGVTLDVGELLGAIVADVGIEADAKGCSVRVSGEGPLRTFADPEALRSAFENVIRNALRYGPVGSVVEVAARGGEDIVVSVRDPSHAVSNGAGGGAAELIVTVRDPSHPVSNGAGGGAAELIVTVRDHGPGVPEKDLKAIFEPFYRVDAARDRAGGGEGLGLAIAARAIALHGGRIEAGNAPGGGLAVTLRLPVRSETDVTPGADSPGKSA